VAASARDCSVRTSSNSKGTSSSSEYDRGPGSDSREHQLLVGANANMSSGKFGGEQCAHLFGVSRLASARKARTKSSDIALAELGVG
jgi:hypothetical protein